MYQVYKKEAQLCRHYVQLYPVAEVVMELNKYATLQLIIQRLFKYMLVSISCLFLFCREKCPIHFPTWS